ncbi:MAG TPA: pyridoxamine 5'-phosphate oxidase [Propylenella sp.]
MNDGNEAAAAEDDAAALTSGDLSEGSDPFALFAEWFAEAGASEPNDPDAMALATVDDAGLPDLRMVLLKGFDRTGFVFYTNLESRKGRQLAAHPRAALLFHWKSLRRQVRVRGPVVPVTPEEADAYFATRPRMSRIGAWASRQSEPLESRFALEKAVARYTARFAAGAIPRPPHWSGFRVIPAEIEFWRDGAFRLHDRVRFSREEGGGWSKARLFP